jgi:hypothetical protein
MTESTSYSSETEKASLCQLPVACDVTCAEPMADAVLQIGETPEKALLRLASEFRATAKVSDDFAVNAAFQVKEMRALVDRGAAGQDVTWYSWALKLGLPPQRIQRYLRIADAPHPHAMRDEYLRQDRERAKKSRKKKKVTDRAWLRGWCLKAPLEDVTYIRKMIEERQVQFPELSETKE